MNNNYIYHHGIKGQRWGVRRFQNDDGTLTPAGKRRADLNTMAGKRFDDKLGTKAFKIQEKVKEKGGTLSDEMAIERARQAISNGKKTAALLISGTIGAIGIYQAGKYVSKEIIGLVEDTGGILGALGQFAYMP